jgi:voltage-gated potassium channel
MSKRKRLLFAAISLTVYLALLVVMVLIERRASDGTIKSLLDAVWYSIVTFSTVGYGDIYPVSLWGKIIGLVFIFVSVGFLGVIIGEITNSFRKRFEKRRFGLMGTDFKDHIIVIGWDAFCKDVITQLINADNRAAVLTDKKDDIDKINQHFKPKQVFACFSDIKNYDSLKLLNIQKAKSIFINNGEDADKLIAILNIKKKYPDISIVVLLDNTELKDTFISAGVTFVLSKNEITSKILASHIFEPAVAGFIKDLITSTDNQNEYDLQQYRVNENNPFLDTKFGVMFGELKDSHNIVAIGLNKHDGRGLIKIPSNEEIIELGDDVIVIANGVTEKIIKKLFKTSEGI